MTVRRTIDVLLWTILLSLLITVQVPAQPQAQSSQSTDSSAVGSPPAAPPPSAPSASMPAAATGSEEASKIPVSSVGCGIKPPFPADSPGILGRVFGATQIDLTPEETEAITRGFPVFPKITTDDTTSTKFRKLRETRNTLIEMIASCSDKRSKDDGVRETVSVKQDDKDLAYLRKLLERIDEAASEALIPESDQNRFKTTLSYVYAAVVGLVIVGLSDRRV